MRLYSIIGILFFALPYGANGQIEENQVGGWYMYFFNVESDKSNFGFQGDIQYRNWEATGDLEQLLLRGGVTYSPDNAKVLFTLGYGNITTGTFGKETSTKHESRIYQEILFPSKIGERVYLNHRLRYEQRFVEGQDFRTRYRYNLFVNVPLNGTEIKENTAYLALYNEIFINGQRDIGNGNRVELFDRNRLYAAVGYVLKPGLKVQLGVMKQETVAWKKKQLQLSVHQKF